MPLIYGFGGVITFPVNATVNSKTQDGAGNPITSHSAGSSRGLDVAVIDPVTGDAVDPRARTWVLDMLTDDVGAAQVGTWTVGRTWTLNSATDSVTAAAVQSGTWTVQAVQSGTWTVARSWTLSSGTDSVAAVQSGAWVTTPAVPAAQTVKQAAITVGTSAVRLTTDAAAPTAGRRKLQYMPDKNSTGAFFIGSSSVTSAGSTRGTEVFPGQLIEETDDANDYYIISDTAAQTVFVVEVE